MSVQIAGMSTRKLYRDCLRLCNHVGADSPKGMAMKAMVKQEFGKYKNVTEEKHIEFLQNDAVRALTNYLVFETKERKHLPQFKPSSEIVNNALKALAETEAAVDEAEVVDAREDSR